MCTKRFISVNWRSVSLDQISSVKIYRRKFEKSNIRTRLCTLNAKRAEHNIYVSVCISSCLSWAGWVETFLSFIMYYLCWAFVLVFCNSLLLDHQTNTCLVWMACLCSSVSEWHFYFMWLSWIIMMTMLMIVLVWKWCRVIWCDGSRNIQNVFFLVFHVYCSIYARKPRFL